MSLSLAECTICLSLLETDIAATRCGHIFHLICILKWTEEKRICPLCKHTLSQNSVIKLFVSPVEIAELLYTKSASATTGNCAGSENVPAARDFSEDYKLLKIKTSHLENNIQTILLANEELCTEIEQQKEKWKKLNNSHNKKCRELKKARNAVSDTVKQLFGEKLKSKSLETEIMALKQDRDASDLIENLRKNLSLDEGSLSGSTFEEKYNAVRLSSAWLADELEKSNKRTGNMRLKIETLENKQDRLRTKNGELIRENKNIKFEFKTAKTSQIDLFQLASEENKANFDNSVENTALFANSADNRTFDSERPLKSDKTTENRSGRSEHSEMETSTDPNETPPKNISFPAVDDSASSLNAAKEPFGNVAETARPSSRKPRLRRNVLLNRFQQNSGPASARQTFVNSFWGD